MLNGTVNYPAVRLGAASVGFEVPDAAVIICAAVILLLVVILAVVVLADSLRGRKSTEAPADKPADTPAPETADAAEPETGRFCMLAELEKKKHTFDQETYEEGVTLEEFCERFRNYAAYELKLYYDIEDIRRFVAGMAVSHILILQGMSGTGKTSLAHAFGCFVGKWSTVIPVQPMWKERTDLIGYYNEFTKHFNESLLLQKMYEANYSRDIYVTVLDEMNIARVEYYFAEFLSLLELPDPEERRLGVVSDVWDTDPPQLKDGTIKLPENMWFIGTANNDDSTFAISDKVYDRAMVLNLDSKCERFAAPPTGETHLEAREFVRLADEACREFRISSRNLQRLQMLDKYLIDRFRISFGNRIMRQILTYVPVYIACGGDELDALDDILAKKLFRKLETQNPIYLRQAAAELSDYLDTLFGEGRMACCQAYIRRLQQNA